MALHTSLPIYKVAYDLLDIANDRAQADNERAVAEARKLADDIPAGVADDYMTYLSGEVLDNRTERAMTA